MTFYHSTPFFSFVIFLYFFFFHMTTTKTFITKPIFRCTTLITLYIQIHTKGGLNKLLLLLLIFWVAFAPCHCATPCRLIGDLKDCYAGHIFFSFIFIYPLQFIKNTKVFTSKLFFFVPLLIYTYTLFSQNGG